MQLSSQLPQTEVHVSLTLRTPHRTPQPVVHLKNMVSIIESGAAEQLVMIRTNVPSTPRFYPVGLMCQLVAQPYLPLHFCRHAAG